MDGVKEDINTLLVEFGSVGKASLVECLPLEEAIIKYLRYD